MYKMINLTFEPFFLRKAMSQKYNLLYYLKRVYVGGFSHWSEQKLQTGLLKMHIYSLLLEFRNIEVPLVTAVYKAVLGS